MPGQNVARIRDAMEKACNIGTGSNISAASIVRAELFSFPKCNVTVDADLHHDIMRRYKIKKLYYSPPSGLMTYIWCHEGCGFVIQALVTRSIMKSILGCTNSKNFTMHFIYS